MEMALSALIAEKWVLLMWRLTVKRGGVAR
jgi:hypothetical protein